MLTFSHTIQASHGLHARPAGKLIQTVKSFDAFVKIESKGKETDARKLIGLMGLGVKKGDPLTFTIEGADEKDALRALKEFCEREL